LTLRIALIEERNNRIVLRRKNAFMMVVRGQEDG